MTEGTSTLTSLVPELSKRFREPQWLQSIRESAWNTYLNTPVKRLEKSDITKRSWDIQNVPLDASSATSEEAAFLLKQFRDTGAAFIYVRDGRVVDVHVPASLNEQGVIFTDLHSAVEAHGDSVQRYFGTVVSNDETKWTALNAAIWHGGAYLYVPRNVQVQDALHFVHEDTGVGGGVAPRVLVVAEDGSELSFVDVHVVKGSADAAVLKSHVVEVVAKTNAKVTYVSVNEFRKGPTNFVTARARADKDAVVDWVFTDVSDGYTVGVVESDLQGSGSRSNTKVLGIGYGRQHLDLTASMLHTGKYSTSDIVMHSVLRERANTVFRSSTHIFKNAVGAGSEQSDRMLVMDGTARADAIPMLLIDENDVQRCGHAASVGRIDETQIYYLMSRGIPKDEAVRLIVWGNLQPTINAIPSEGVREFVASVINRELI